MVQLLSRADYAKLIIALPFVTFLLWLPAFLNIQSTLQEIPQGILFYLFDNWLNIEQHTNFWLIIAVVFVVANALLLFLVNFHFSVFFSKSAFNALIYVIICSSFAINQQFSAVLPAALFFNLSVIKILEMHKKASAISTAFEASFYIAIGSFFYFNTIYFTLLVWIGLIIYRPFFWREWVVVLLGSIAPYLTFFVFYYGITGDASLVIQKTIDTAAINSNWNFSSLDIVQIIFFIFLGFIALLSVGFSVEQALKIKQRKAINLLIFTLLCSIGVYVAIPASSFEMLYFIAFPLSFLMANYLVNVKSVFVAETVFLAFTGLAVAGFVLHV